MSVFIATPAYQGMVSKEYTLSLLAASRYCENNGIPVMAGILENAIFVEMARNHLVGAFLQSPCTHLMFIDADIGFQEDAIYRLVTSGKEVTAGVCPQRDGKRFCAVPNGEMDGEWVGHSRVGAGFLCIERKALEWNTRVDGAPHVFRTKFEPTENGEYQLVGEDYTFCDDYGKTIWVYPNLTFSHAGVLGNYARLLGRSTPFPTQVRDSSTTSITTVGSSSQEDT